MREKVLILGAGGLFGRNALRAFQAAGWDVRAYKRGTDMAEAAKGVQLIVNAMNPQNYHNWTGLVPAITEQVIGAAKSSGATILFPGNVYVYGKEPGPWNAATPHRPVSRKGAVRVAAEARYRAAAAEGLRVIILRGGDFIDADAPGSILRLVTLKHLARNRLSALAELDVPRSFANLPDMARAAVALAERRADLPAFADIPFAGLTFSTRDLAREIERQTGRPPQVTAFPWWLLRLTAPFWELARELTEMRYLYRLPHSLDPAPLAAILPEFRQASLAEVVSAHLPPLRAG
ncbi:MAG: epimerase [Paracoccaceae bacterium]